MEKLIQAQVGIKEV